MENPTEYVDSTQDLALIRVGKTMIMIGIDDDERIYFVIKDDETTEDWYLDEHYPKLSAKEIFYMIYRDLPI